MNELEKHDTDSVMAVLAALQAEMAADLDELQNEIRVVAEAEGNAPESGDSTLSELLAARTALHSGLASIREVCGWIDWIMERDAEEDATPVTMPLPGALGSPIH
ncbi:hypothetical protein [Massilia sp. METH4]|uniref:hypothetical protein n=1 Tax=Massilia sp. METH4 TaxID=3123041 RepID=UPI0030D40957